MTKNIRRSVILITLLSACTPAPECTTQSNQAHSTCVPVDAQAQSTLQLQARPEGCSNVCNGTSEYACSVTVEGQTITLALTRTECIEPEPAFPAGPVTACDTACAIPDPVPCEVPPLAEGTYTVRADGAPDETLSVVASGRTTCASPPSF